MDNRTLQTPTIKINSEFVDKATELITKITEQFDKCCPACQALLKIGLVTSQTTDDNSNHSSNQPEQACLT